MSILILMMAAVMGADSAPPVAEGVFVAPDWARKPTGMEVVQFYPLLPALTGMRGHATITCAVTVSGALEGCQVIEETPPEWGFGSAALKLSKVLRMRPATLDGKPVDGASVTIPLNFDPSAASGSLPGLSESLACYGRFSARLRADPTDAKADLGAQWSRYWADKSMKLERIKKPYREKRLAAAASMFAAPPAWSAADGRCEAAFLPVAPA